MNNAQYTVEMLSPAGRKALAAWRKEMSAETAAARKAARQERGLAMTEFTKTDSVIFSTLCVSGA